MPCALLLPRGIGGRVVGDSVLVVVARNGWAVMDWLESRRFVFVCIVVVVVVVLLVDDDDDDVFVVSVVHLVSVIQRQEQRRYWIVATTQWHLSWHE